MGKAPPAALIGDCSNERDDWHIPAMSAIYDRLADDSIFNRAEGVLLRSIDELPDDMRDLGMSRIKGGLPNGIVTVVMGKLRRSFWQNYVRAIHDHSTFGVRDVVAGIMNDDYFRSHTLPNNYKMAYLLHPWRDASALVTDLHQMGLEKVEQILEMIPLTNDKGEFNLKNAKLVFDMMKWIHECKFGAAVTRQLTVHANANLEKLPEAARDKSIEEMEEEIDKLRAADPAAGGSRKVVRTSSANASDIIDIPLGEPRKV